MLQAHRIHYPKRAVKSETVKHCLVSARQEQPLEPFEAEISDPFGLTMEQRSLLVSAPSRVFAEAFVARYNRRVRPVSFFLAGWFLCQNLLFFAMLADKIERSRGLEAFSAMIAVLGAVYLIFPYTTFDLYTAYGIRRGQWIVRAIAGCLIVAGVALRVFTN